MSNKTQSMAKSTRAGRVEARVRRLEDNFAKMFNQLREVDLFQMKQQRRVIGLENRLDGKKETTVEVEAQAEEKTNDVDRNGEREGPEVVGDEGAIADRQTQPANEEPAARHD